MSTSVITRTDRSRWKVPLVASLRGDSQQPLAGRNPRALQAAATASGVAGLNQLLAGTLTLRDLYQEHPQRASGRNFYGVYRLFDKHFEEQSELVDRLAERLETLREISIPRLPDVAQAPLIPRLRKGRAGTATQIAQLLQVHEVILVTAWAMARERASTAIRDLEINDIIVFYVIRTNESEAWFLAEHMQ